jgi:hypothetical protein
MLEQRENAAFLDEPLPYRLTRAEVSNELERDALPELRAFALGQVDDAHTAVAELADDAECAGALRRSGRCARWALEQWRRQFYGR